MTEPESTAAAKPKRRSRRGGVRHRKKSAGEGAAVLAPPFEVFEAPAPAPPISPAAPETVLFTSAGGPSLMTNLPTEEQRLAVFIDFDNLAIGAREAKYPKFDIDLMLERLLEKGKIVYKKAYADWSRYLDY
ncbi:MAG TPA: NYN domain-containing protein, partial [Thermoanaerobaculia bacterium]|nr:NYN domain-containing protein [Thermoanaerobaculia bacterium]